MERFRQLRTIFEDKNAKCPFGEKTNTGIEDIHGTEYIAGESMYENLRRHRISSGTKYHMKCFAFYNGDKWIYETDEGTPDSEYLKKLDEFIDSQDDDTVLASIDCHI